VSFSKPKVFEDFPGKQTLVRQSAEFENSATKEIRQIKN
jgi:hypothetical protein